MPNDFDLTSPGKPGEIPAGVVEELRVLRTNANESVAIFRDAVKVQAEKHKIKPKALRRYVNALASDKVDETRAETVDLEKLLGVAEV
jgi:hypothetical protein